MKRSDVILEVIEESENAIKDAKIAGYAHPVCFKCHKTIFSFVCEQYLQIKDKDVLKDYNALEVINICWSCTARAILGEPPNKQ